MDVLNLQGSISLDTSAYETALQRAVNLATQAASSMQSAAGGGAQQLQSTMSAIGSAADSSAPALTNQANAAQQSADANAQLVQSAIEVVNSQQQLQNSTNQSNQSTEQSTRQTMSLSERLEQLKIQYQDSINAVNTLTQKYLESAQRTGADSEATRQLGEQLANATNYSNTLGNEVNRLSGQLRDSDDRSKSWAATIQNALSVALGNLLTQAITKAKDALVAFAKESVSVGMSFDSAMSQVAATMGVTADKVGNLRNFAQEMGSTTAYSATQAAEA